MKRITCILITVISLAINSFGAEYHYSSTNGVTFAWQDRDMIAVFTDGGELIAFWTREQGSNTANFVSGYGLLSETHYRAFAPFYIETSGYTAETVLSMKYDGQKQTANNNLAHLAAYDYMQAETVSSSSDAVFNFKHLGSVLSISAMLNTDETLTAMTFDAGQPITLQLNNISVEKGARLTAFMMIPPMNLDGKKITLTLRNIKNEMSEVTLNGCNIMAGKCYPIEFTCPEFSSVENAMFETKVVASPRSNPTSLDAKTTLNTIESPKAFVPDLLLDNENKLEVYEGLLGDVNGDGKVMVNDAVLLVNHYLADTLDTLDVNICDVNHDGIVSVADAVAIVNIYLHNE